jgi:hypothetical protein
MIVPSLHHLGIGGGDIHLTELQKQIIICPEDLHDPSPIIGDHPQAFCLHPVYHCPLPIQIMFEVGG